MVTLLLTRTHKQNKRTLQFEESDTHLCDNQCHVCTANLRC